MSHETTTIKLKKGHDTRTINATSITGSTCHSLIVEDTDGKNVYARKIYVGSLNYCQFNSFMDGWIKD
jgi:hypothetical protein